MSDLSSFVFESCMLGASPAKQNNLKKFLQTSPCPLTSQLFDSKNLQKPLLDLCDIHYSWIEPLIENLTETDKALFTSTLNKKTQSKLNAVEKEPISLSGLATHFIQDTIIDSLLEEENNFFPSWLLPRTSIYQLLDLSYEKLLNLIDYLGLHDLAFDIKHVLESAKMKKILSILTKKEHAYFDKLTKKKEPLSFSSLHLEKWDGNETDLRGVLHFRGINRLAKAIYGSHSSMLWHISHKLDIKRASVLKKHYTPLQNKKAHQLLTGQVIELASNKDLI